MVTTFVHDPDAILDYYLDWSAWLGDDTLSESTWSADHADITLSQSAILGPMTQIWVQGGTVHSCVTLTNHIVTADGREDDRSLQLLIREQ